jgi:hypothetical protein
MIARSIICVVATLAFTSCGTTSSLQTTGGVSASSPTKFSKVVVQDFKVSVPEHAEQAATARTTFPDRIAAEIRKTGRFASVSRNSKADANTLVISGVITKFDEGSTQKRIWLGMGFGMAFLEATVSFRDSNGRSIGTIKVDRNSWPMGGAIAAAQSPQTFMNGAADTVAEEAAKRAR